MADWEKVIQSLECKLTAHYDTCKDCPYFSEELAEDYQEFEYFCNRSQIEADALELLKSQEPRLITKDDFRRADAWGTIPAWIEYNPAIEGAEPGWTIIDSGILGSPFKKAWTSRPTDAQREKVKWE